MFYYKSIDSTQKEVYRRIENRDILSGDVIIADIQTNAIGTHGRRWYADAENIVTVKDVIEYIKNK